MTEFEEEFFKRNKIDNEKCVDVKGNRMNWYVKYWMQRNNKLFAFNAFPCKNGHTIKNSKGQCIVCNSAKISYQMREHESGYLYIAGTKWGKRIKIGCTTNYEKREKYLNENKGYGFFADWKILAVAKVDEMGFRERQIQEKLEKYREFGLQYYRGNELKKSNEAFRCNYETTLKLLRDFCAENKFHLKIFESDTSKYNFKNLIKSE